MAGESSNRYRFVDVADQPTRRMPPIRGFENMPLVSLEEATQHLVPFVLEIEHMVDIVKGNTKKPKGSLTIDESASIALYSMEWSPRQNSFYIILNETLRKPNRADLLPPWFKYLKLFLTALSKLSPMGRRTIFRGVKLDLQNKYTRGERVVWWGFSSCTSSVEVLENEQFFGKTGARTIFAIECDNGKDIRQHSFYQDEDEILLLPGSEFEVVGLCNMGNNLHMIQLKEAVPKFPNLAAVSSSAGEPKPVPKTKPVTPYVKISYQSKKITDTDITRVIKEALIQQQCTELDLSWNQITHEGAAILCRALRDNTVRNQCYSLIHINNHRSHFNLKSSKCFLRKFILKMECIKVNYSYFTSERSRRRAWPSPDQRRTCRVLPRFRAA